MSGEIPTGAAARLQPCFPQLHRALAHMPEQGGAFARVAQAIADVGGDAERD